MKSEADSLSIDIGIPEATQLDLSPLPFDRLDYGLALRYLGNPSSSLGKPVVLRSIPNADEIDAFGPFPYSTAPGDAVAFCQGLAGLGAVTWTAVMRPGTLEASIALLNPMPIKEHFVYKHSHAPLQHSAKTRRHIRHGHEMWDVEVCGIGSVLNDLIRLHHELESRAPLSRVARVDAEHFRQLSMLDDIHCVVARANGRVGAFLVFAKAGDQIHYHLTAGSLEALHQDAMYALFDFMIEFFGPTNDLFMGGEPAGTNGEGVGRFKARFANARVPVFLVRAIIDPVRCQNLIGRLGEHRWFPPYRDPKLDQGIEPRLREGSQ